MPDSSVLITGVSSGLGHALASFYLSRGAQVYGVSRRAPTDLMDQGLAFKSVDLSDPVRTEAILSDLLADVAVLTLAILNAGILSPFGDLADQSLETLKHVNDVNLWANKTVIDTLFEGRRSVDQIVAVSSGASVNGSRGWNGYSISKASLNMLIKLYAAEHSDTHFCALAPGLIDTAMQHRLCELRDDGRFPALNVLKSKRGTAAMPDPVQAAEKIAGAIDRIPSLVNSGDYADLRKPPLGTA